MRVFGRRADRLHRCRRGGPGLRIHRRCFACAVCVLTLVTRIVIVVMIVIVPGIRVMRVVVVVTGCLVLMRFVVARFGVAMSGVVVMVAVVRQRLGGPAFLFVKMPLAFRLLAFKMLLAFIGLGGLQGIL